FPVTVEGVRQWLRERVLRPPGRVLFWVCDVRGVPVGHLGLRRVDGVAPGFEVIDRLAALAGSGPLMEAASAALGGWVRGAAETPRAGRPGESAGGSCGPA
ncbi:MAG: hypothetical protein ACRC33_25980, partial [Gemmataceae bacterium]